MDGPTSLVRIVCRSDRADQTARLVAWTTGHPVDFEEPPAAATPRITECLIVDTHLTHDERAVRILEELGLEIVGKIDGVLSWTVIPSDECTAGGETRAQSVRRERD